ncbi:hypothetical protein ACHAWF_008993 [Thalassiosira exigua]
MCSKSGARDRRREWTPNWKRQRPRQSAAAPKRMHLVTDDGFGRRLAANLLGVASATSACYAHRPARDFAVDFYHDLKDAALEIAGEMAWWSALALLSSSCCALQVLLNALSLGCAGFNGWLGPARPTFVALTIAAQVSSWCVAYPRPRQWRPAATCSLLSAGLTLLPEFLAWRSEKRLGRRDVSGVEVSVGRTLHVRFHIPTMGCSACVSTVTKVLDGIDGVIQHRVTLEDGLAEILLDGELTCNKGKGTLQEHLQKDIADRLNSSGFPVEWVSKTE